MGVLIIIPIWRSGYARGGLDAQQLLRLGGGRRRFLVKESHADHRWFVGRVVRGDSLVHYVQSHESLVPKRAAGRLWIKQQPDQCDRFLLES